MPVEITMPQLSDTMSEGTLVKWHKKEGEAVKAGEEIADVETDKATMPMESFEAGLLAYIAVAEGQKVAVGARLAVIATAGEDAKKVREEAAAGAGSAGAAGGMSQAGGKTGGTASADEASLQRQRGEAPREQTREEPTRSSEAIAQSAQQRSAGIAPAPAPAPGEDRGERLRVSPLARRMAEEAGLRLEDVPGSGPNGRIIERDVRQFIDGGRPAAKPAVDQAGKAAAAPAPSPAPGPAPVPSGQVQTIALTKMRAVIAQRLQQSKQSIPHFYETIDIDMEAVMSLRQRINESLESQGVKLSVNDFVVKAVATALVRHPALNAHFSGEQISRFGDVHLGLAVALEEGLIVPVLRGASQMGLRDIRLRTVDLYERARQQKLKREELSGATFTISSLGSFGIREFSAIINPPEVAILAVGAAEPRPAVHGGQVVARMLMTVSLSADHRVVDGATAADFLRTLKQLLEEPAMMLV